MRFIYITLIIWLFNGFFNINAQKKIPPQKPKLIIQIVISNMKYDYINKYWDNFGDNGFKKLIKEGANCKNNQYKHIYAQNTVGVTSIASGTTPSNHGIVSENWYNRLKNEITNCVIDKKHYSIGGVGINGSYSPKNIRVTTFTDELRMFSNFESKIYSISVDAGLSVLLGGHMANAAYWFDDLSGNWISNTYYMESLPEWVKEFNKREYPEIYQNRVWTSSLEKSRYTISSIDTSNKTSLVPILNLSKTKSLDAKYNVLVNTPFANTFTKDFAISTIIDEELGQDDITDYIAITFSASNKIGNRYGSLSIENEDCFIKLDRDIEHFIKFIDEQLGKENVLFVVTSDNGIAYKPEYLKKINAPGGYFEANKAISLLKSYLSLTYGSGDWVKYYHKNQIYLNHDLISDSKINLSDIQDKVAEFMIQFEGINNALTATNIRTANYSNGTFEKVANSFYSERSGDIILILDPGWIESDNGSLCSNSGYRYETHVPLIWYGWKIKKTTIYKQTSPIDIAPTLSLFLNISAPNATSGKPIYDIL